MHACNHVCMHSCIHTYVHTYIQSFMHAYTMIRYSAIHCNKFSENPDREDREEEGGTLRGSIEDRDERMGKETGR